MIDWLKSLLSSVAMPGVKSRRLVSVVVGVVLLAWLVASWLAQALVEIPPTVLLLVALCIGTVAMDKGGVT